MLEHPTFTQATRRSVQLGVVVLAMWTVVGTVGFMWIEEWPFVDALYMTIITLSTVGYGEIRPLTPEGRLFATAFIVVGITTAIYTLTRVGQVVLEGELFGGFVRRRMQKTVNNLSNHYIICGYGRTARPVIEGMREKDLPFVIIDHDPQNEPDLQEHRHLYLIEDATKEETLQDAGIERAKAVLALLPSDAENLYITVTAKHLKPDVRVIARAAEDAAEKNLIRGGADDVVLPYNLAGHRLLQAAVNPTVMRFMELMTDRAYEDLSLGEARITSGSPLHKLSLTDAKIRSKFGVIVVAIKREPDEMIFNPDPTQILQEQDTLVVLGTTDSVSDFHRSVTR